ncbi:MAG: hypothetical protein KF780_08160 [Sphingomonas sp.]|nr:hypothetical protein [Sphingomonas sp.]
MTGDEPAPPPSRQPDGCALALLAAALCVHAIILFAGLMPQGQHDPQGGVAMGIIMLLEIPLWLLLGAFGWWTLKDAGLPQPVLIGAALLLLLCAYASLDAFNVIGLTGRRGVGPVLALILLPLIALGFAAWARSSAGEPDRRRIMAASGFGLVAVVLVASVMLAGRDYRGQVAADRAEANAEEQRRDAALDALLASGDTRLEQLLEYIYDEGPPRPAGGMSGERGERARAGIQRLPSRQADAMRLLARPDGLERLEWMSGLNLAVTPELCGTYVESFGRLIGGLAAGNPGLETAVTGISRQDNNLRWLLAGGCDLLPTLERTIDAARRLPPYSTSPGFVEYLESLRAAPAEGP